MSNYQKKKGIKRIENNFDIRIENNFDDINYIQNKNFGLLFMSTYNKKYK